MNGRGAIVAIEVPFHDVDMLRIVWHGHYLKYFEIARTQLFRDAGLGEAELEKRGIYFVIVESRCRHTRPLRLGERASIEARFLPSPGRPAVVYRVRNEATGEVAARGRTDLAVIDLATHAMIDTPSDVLERMNE